MPLREVGTVPPDVVLDCHHHNNQVYDEKRAPPRVTVEPSDYQLNDLSGSQTIEIHESTHELATGLPSYRSGSRSPSLRSHTAAQSQNPSLRGSQVTMNSAQSTPKMLRLARIRPVNIPTKETLKRTASHTPEVTRPAKCSSLRRTKSASHSFGEDTRFSADFSICSDQTSCESLSSEADSPTRKQHLSVPMDNLGECEYTSSIRVCLQGGRVTLAERLL